MISELMANTTPKRLSDGVREIRKDALMVDFARVICPHYGKMVEHFSRLEGTPISAHNNKTLFLEAVDLSARYYFSPGRNAVPRMGETRDPKMVIAHVMTPYYEALQLDNPRKYKMGKYTPPPRYVGNIEDAVVVELGLLAALDVGPLNLRFGGHREGGQEVFDHVWGSVHADGKWYDTDIFESEKLGDAPRYPIIRDVEIEL